MKSTSSDIISRTAHALARLGVKSSSRVLVAVSGGVDSLSLALILHSLLKQGHLKKLGIVHINHLLRGSESDRDEALVRRFAKKYKVPVYTFRCDTRDYALRHRIGIEEAARHLRYETIGRVAAQHKFQFVATAHTANDQTETILMNIVRGSGINGMRGIPESRAISETTLLIRPVLELHKRALQDFAKKNRIRFREDSSNATLDFQRNRVRHLVLPKLEEAFGDRDIYSGFSRMSQNISSVAVHIQTEVTELREKLLVAQPSIFIRRRITFFDKAGLLEAPVFLRRELLVQEASALSGTVVTVDYIQSVLLESYLSYSPNTVTKTFHLTPEIIVRHDGSSIAIEKEDAPPAREHVLTTGKNIVTPVGAISLKKVRAWQKPADADTAYFRFADIAGKALLVRFWKPGDKMKPFGMKGKTRLVSDILSEAGIKSERLKYFVPLVVFRDEPEFILWIPGVRSAEFARLRSTSETALQLQRNPKGRME